MSHDHDHGDFDLSPGLIPDGPTEPTWIVTDALGGHVGDASSLEEAQQLAIDDDGRGRTWADLACCGLYLIDEVALVRERR